MKSLILGSGVVLLLISGLSSCENATIDNTKATEKTVENDTTKKSLEQTESSTDKEITETKEAASVYVCPAFNFELTLPAGWEAADHFSKKMFEDKWEVYPKTADGFDKQQKREIQIPLLVLPIKKWEAYEKTLDIKEIPEWGAGGGGEPSVFLKNENYAYIIRNRWQFSFEEEDQIKVTEDVLKSIKTYQ